jgi:RimJ/RimL family protein N-acetyltransferase
MQTIFETKNLTVRKLKISDFDPFHEMQSNHNVMQYVSAKVMTFQENKKELPHLIDLYNLPNNDFWIYAIERKSDNIFVGTIAFVKDENKEDEIGYRFLEKYWGKGYGTEIVEGMICYCKKVGFVKLVACVVNKNVASTKIIKKAGFTFIKDFVSDDLQLPEQKFEKLL